MTPALWLIGGVFMVILEQARRRALPLVLVASLWLPALSLGQVLGGPSQGFRFSLPAGWKGAQQEGTFLLGHDSIPGMILVWGHQLPSPSALVQTLSQGYQEEGILLQPLTPLEPAGKNACLGNFQGYAQGQMVVARVAGVSFPGGGGVYVAGLANPQVFQPALAQAVETIARGVEKASEASPSATTGSPTAPDALIQHFAGSWQTTTRNSETSMVLRPDGSYSQAYSSSYSGNFSDSGGNDLGNWGTARDDRSKGRWQAQGTTQQGVLSFTDQTGTSQMPYRVHVEKGQTYWREYWVDGVLWRKN